MATEHRAAPRGGPSRRRWRVGATVRTRTVAVAVLVVGVALGAGSFLLVAQVRASELSGIDRALRLEASSVAGLATLGTLPPLLQSTSDQTAFIQVIGPRGTVLASSPSLEGQGPITRVAIHGGVPRLVTLSDLPLGSGGRYRLVVLGVSTPAGRYTIYVGQGIAAVDSSLASLIKGLLFFDPLLVCIVGLIVLWLLGRALAPVEAIRTEVADISVSARNRRISVPAARDEVGRLADTMNGMLARLDATNRRHRSFVSDVSHELRSPLAAAQSELEVGLAHEDAADWPDVARLVLGDLERTRRIVEDLLILVQHDEGLVAAVTDEVDLDDVVFEECTHLRGITSIAVDVADVSGARVHGDREWLARIVRNLLDNAARHARSRVTVTLGDRDGVVELRVSDDGPGIPPEDRERVFDRFSRLDDARARESGASGLGLAIVREIASAHLGTVHVDDRAPGAHVVVSLPSVERDIRGSTRPASPVSPASSRARTTRDATSGGSGTKPAHRTIP